ncbi:hypothetical protein WDU99_08345 [Microbacterium sp. Mu-80]|uniref:Uncharacterized protein n=1 Tax=Microbacterium bandirmense TaxID=3122050 RepID=A0ABU8LC23_9MICO
MATPTTHWEAQQLPPENTSRLLTLLFGPEAEPAREADDATPPDCGLWASFDRLDAHLAQFHAEAVARELSGVA